MRKTTEEIEREERELDERLDGILKQLPPDKRKEFCTELLRRLPALAHRAEIKLVKGGDLKMRARSQEEAMNDDPMVTKRNQRVAELAAKIVAPAFGPLELWNHVTEYIHHGDENFRALCAAIDPRYPELKSQKARKTPDAHAYVDALESIHLIEDEAHFFIGVAVGQHVRR